MHCSPTQAHGKPGMIHIQVELANKIGRNVGLVFSKLKEGSESKLLLYKRLDGAN